MKIRFTNRNPRDYLSEFKRKQLMAFDLSELVEKSSEITVPVGFQPSSDFLFDYRIFPSQIMTACCEWICENRPMRIGDTIVQLIHFPPAKSPLATLVMGVRITEIFNEPGRVGFSYQTLEGHVEKGISTFTLEKNDSSHIFRIHTFSTPGNLPSRLLASVLSLRYQQYCTDRALKWVLQQLSDDLPTIHR